MVDPKRIDTLGHVALMFIAAMTAAIISRQVVVPALATTKETDGFKEAVQILTRADGDLDRLDAEIRNVAEALKATDSLLPKTINLDAFLEDLGTLAETTGVRIERLTPSQVSESRLLRELVLEVQVSGPFLAVADFMHSLECGSQLSRVNHLEITGDASADGCAATLGLALYYAPEGGD